MQNANATLDEQLSALLPKALDAFSNRAIEGARRALADAANPLRLNFFSVAMPMLFEHMMGTLAPVEDVKKCRWFKPAREGGGPTRAAMLLSAPLVLSQITMRKMDGCQSVAESLLIRSLTSPHEAVTSSR